MGNMLLQAPRVTGDVQEQLQGDELLDQKINEYETRQAPAAQQQPVAAVSVAPSAPSVRTVAEKPPDQVVQEQAVPEEPLRQQESHLAECPPSGLSGAPTRDSKLQIHPDFHPGDVVKLCGLSAAAELNGEQATCGAWDSEKGRIVLHLASGEVKNVRPENLVKVVPSRKRRNSSRSTDASDTMPSPKRRFQPDPALPPSPRGPRVGIPKMDFDDKINLDADDLFKKDVFLAVKAYVGAHSSSWSFSLMHNDISEEQGWEHNKHLVNLVKASLLKLGFQALGATGGGSLKSLKI